jgi:hypothetical protein
VEHPKDASIFALESLRESEINFTISTFFDGGWSFRLGDSTNGYLTGIDVDTFEEGLEWLWQAAEKHFPEAECFSG